MRRLLVVGTVLAVCGACGGGSDSTASGGASGSEAAAPAAQTPADAGAKALEQMFQQPGSSAPAVDYTVLKAMVPEIQGWERSEVKGEQGAFMNMSYSNAKGEFTKGEVSVALEITDTAMIQGLVMPFAMIAAGGFNQRSDDGYKRGVTINGHPGWEEWDIPGKSGEINVLVGKRFIVKGSGHDLPNMDPVKQVVESVNMTKLAALK
jgi:hypothetical protein